MSAKLKDPATRELEATVEGDGTLALGVRASKRTYLLAQVARLNLSAYPAFVMPRLEPIYGQGGEITDVRISYPASLTVQMLEYSAVSRTRAT